MPANDKRNGRFTEDGLLDATNRRLVDELQADARTSLAELGRRVGLSSPAVAERLRRLEEEGVITGYRAEVDPRKLGYSLGVVIRIRPAPRQLVAVADLARRTAEIVECHRVTGDDCYVMTAHVRDVTHLEEVIDQFAAYGQTTTSIMQSSPVPRRPLGPK
ncbi:MAG: Lrp/AsnC family transcriptional regulator, leucine-responsive regulatory protein [Thermoleophilaceae bacterium]|nr:Lrp/AsnC family transcriptional regulator, leucine-responsive regulatory protein [Thermoleophilaceae bacterium]